MRRVEPADVLAPEQVADFLRLVARMESCHTVQEMFREVIDDAEPRLVIALFRIRPAALDELERTIGAMLKHAPGTSTHTDGKRFRRAIRRFRALAGLAESVGGRPRKHPVYVSRLATSHDTIAVCEVAPPSIEHRAPANRPKPVPPRSVPRNARSATSANANTGSNGTSVRVRRLG
jgi:hypothetical protein